YLGLVAMWIVPAYLAVLYVKEPVGADPVRWFGLIALVSVAAALFSIYRAHHAFIHYLLFLILPFSMAVAWMLIQVGQSSWPVARGFAFVALLMVLIVAYQHYMWSFQNDHVFAKMEREIRAPEGEFIRSLVTRNGRIFVWGWTVRPYLSSGHVSAT